MTLPCCIFPPAREVVHSDQLGGRITMINAGGHNIEAADKAVGVGVGWVGVA